MPPTTTAAQPPAISGSPRTAVNATIDGNRAMSPPRRNYPPASIVRCSANPANVAAKSADRGARRMARVRQELAALSGAVVLLVGAPHAGQMARKAARRNEHDIESHAAPRQL